jgi:chaperonin cofactor prefoldin
MNDTPEVTRKNILAVKDHSEYTRGMVTKLTALVEAQNNTVETLQGQVNNLQVQLQALQVKLYTGGSTDGNNN